MDFEKEFEEYPRLGYVLNLKVTLVDVHFSMVNLTTLEGKSIDLKCSSTSGINILGT